MMFPENLAPDLMRIVKPVYESDEPDHIKLKSLWDTLATMQSVLIAHLLAGRIGENVFAGPFRGMRLVKDIMNRPFAPELLGTSQWEIHDKIEQLIARAYKHILVIGCGFGYNTTGFALRLPQSIVHACETQGVLRDLAKKMAEANDVHERVFISEKLSVDDLSKFAHEDLLLVIDDVDQAAPFLDAAHASLLAKTDLLIRRRHAPAQRAIDLVPPHFATSHEITLICGAPFAFPLEKVLGPDCPLDHFDSLLATWEHREGPMSYGLFLRKGIEIRERP